MLKLQLRAWVVLDKYLLVASEEDPAGTTMVKCLTDGFGFSRSSNDPVLRSPDHQNASLFVSQSGLLYREDLDSLFPDTDAFVFLSKHKSDSKIPALTCHCTGNFGSNPYGGSPGEIAISYPALQKSYVRELHNSQGEVPQYEIIIEATHHGPTSLKKPVLFVELGSSEEQWGDVNAAMLVCRSLLAVIQKGPMPCREVAIAIGGTHYPKKFHRLLLDSEIGLAAVASKHSLRDIEERMMGQMVAKSVEKVTTIALDLKGLGEHKSRIMQLAESTGLVVLNLK